MAFKCFFADGNERGCIDHLESIHPLKLFGPTDFTSFSYPALPPFHFTLCLFHTFLVPDVPPRLEFIPFSIRRSLFLLCTYRASSLILVILIQLSAWKSFSLFLVLLFLISLYDAKSNLSIYFCIFIELFDFTVCTYYFFKTMLISFLFSYYLCNSYVFLPFIPFYTSSIYFLYLPLSHRS